MTKLDDLIKVLTDLRGQPLNDVLYEIENLHAVRDWAISQLGIDYEEGDYVQIVNPPVIKNDSNGWWTYREVLTTGRVGVAGPVRFSSLHKIWYCDLLLTHTWSTHKRKQWNKPPEITRYWNGPVDQTPAGYEPPSDFDRARHPDGRPKIFMLKAQSLAKAPAQYEPGEV